MLKHVSLVLICSIIYYSCGISNSNAKIEEKSLKRVGSTEYNRIFESIEDSLSNWKTASIKNWEELCVFDYSLDSIVCFNIESNRFVAGVHIIKRVPNAISDGIREILGEKVDGRWYFFGGSYYIVPRENFSGNKAVPLNYTQLHAASIEYLFSPYLLLDDESWFQSKFEGSGWGDLNSQEYLDWCLKGKRYTDIKEYYKAAHICAAKSIWRDRDTTQRNSDSN